MVTIDFDVTIGRSPEQVFEWLEDPEKVVQWQGWAAEVKQETPGPRGVGTRFRDVRKFLGRRIDSTVEFTDYEPPRTLGLRVEAGPIPFRVMQKLEPAGDATHVVVHAEGEPGGFFKLAEPIVARAAERQMKGDFDTLKDLLEAS